MLTYFVLRTLVIIYYKPYQAFEALRRQARRRRGPSVEETHGETPLCYLGPD